MLTITMTSPKMEGEVIFSYNEKNWLTSLHITECLTEIQYQHLHTYMPWKLEMLKALSAASPAATFAEKVMEVTFDMFWNRYNDKDRSSKKKTLIAWNKMPVTEQIKAYLYYPTYNRKRGSAEKKYATTYLNDELWNN